MDWWYNNVFALAREQCGHNHLTGTEEQQHKITLVTAVVLIVVTYSLHARLHRGAVWSLHRHRTEHFHPPLTPLAVCH